MNWYKKIAMPYVNSIEGVDNYLELGHEGFLSKDKPKYEERSVNHQEIWWIDSNYKFFSKDVTDDRLYSHMNVAKDFGVDMFLVVASGRYERSKKHPEGICSLVINPRKDSKKIEYTRKRVEKILDYQYDGPKIKEFGKSLFGLE